MYDMHIFNARTSPAGTPHDPSRTGARFHLAIDKTDDDTVDNTALGIVLALRTTAVVSMSTVPKGLTVIVACS